jgi:hypothetical protein
MAMPDYPTDLPRPETSAYAGSVNYGLIIDGVGSARPNTKTTYNSPRADLSLTFAMDNETYAINWRPWVLANGYDWFNMEIVNPNAPTNITSIQRVRFTSGMQYEKRGDNWLAVTIGVEMVPADVLQP